MSNYERAIAAEFASILGKTIREIRLSKRLSQSRLVELIIKKSDFSIPSRYWLSKVENGKLCPSVISLVVISAGLDIRLSTLIKHAEHYAKYKAFPEF
jgi:transcriptional regulator with XRE-family HTH domain